MKKKVLPSHLETKQKRAPTPSTAMGGKQTEKK